MILNGFARCPSCDGKLSASGVEVHRITCEGCGQDYQVVVQFVPVDKPKLLEPDALRNPTSTGSR